MACKPKATCCGAHRHPAPAASNGAAPKQPAPAAKPARKPAAKRKKG